MRHQLEPLGVLSALDRLLTILNDDSTSQFRILGQQVLRLVASVAANIHEHGALVITGHGIVKRDHIEAVALLGNAHEALEVFQKIGVLLQPGEEAQLRVKPLLQRRALRLVLVTRLLQEVGKGLESRVADGVEEAHGTLDPGVGQGVRSLSSNVLVRPDLPDKAIGNQVAHDAADQRWIGHGGLGQLG